MSKKIEREIFMILLWLILIFMILAFFRFPFYLSTLIPSLLYLFINNDRIDFIIAFQKMLGALDSFPLLAIPFFLVAGQIMNQGGITDKIFNFANALVGHLKGGLGYVNVIASLIFSGMSGAAAADVGGLGIIELKAMRDRGYDDGFSLGITAASSIIGPIFPPSLPAVIYGALANVSVGALFIGGVIPALLMVIILCIAVAIIAKKRNYPVEKKPTFKEFLFIFKEALLALGAPVIIIGGIWGGIVTPTEAAFITIFYSLFISIVIYKELKLKELPKILKRVAKMIAPSIPIIGPAVLFGWILVFEHADQVLLEYLFAFTTNKYLMLLVINIFLLIVGMFIDCMPALIILTPILKPIILALGIHPVHFGIIIILNFMIGLLTPPVGSVLFMLSAVTGVPLEKIIPDATRFIIPLIIVLLIVTYFPELVLFLPRLAGLV